MYQRLSPVCYTTDGPSHGQRFTRFTDGRCGLYRKETNVLETFKAHGWQPRKDHICNCQQCRMTVAFAAFLVSLVPMFSACPQFAAMTPAHRRIEVCRVWLAYGIELMGKSEDLEGGR